MPTKTSWSHINTQHAAAAGENMFSKNIIHNILDGFDGIAYLTDFNTHELLYLNEKLASYLNIKQKDEYARRKCHEVLQEKDCPCTFCSSKLLSLNKIHGWELYNPQLQRFFEFKESVFEAEGKKLRLKFGVDVTHLKKYIDAIEANYSREQILVNCAKAMCSEENFDYAVSSILEQIVLFFNADRSYLFEHDINLNTLIATHVYVKPQVKSFRNILSAVAQDELQEWLYQFYNGNEVYLQNVETDLDLYPELYEAFKERDIQNLLIFPICSKDKFIGIIGVDNARNNLKNKELLCTIALFVIDNLQKRKTIDTLSFINETDVLTGNYNRKKFNSVIRRLHNIQGQFGIIYVTINELKKINDTRGREYGDGLLQEVSIFLTKHFANHIYRISGDEFVIILENTAKDIFEKRVNQFMEELKFKPSMSLSVGECWGENEFIDDILQKADQIMFKRKTEYSSEKQA